jgi:release factor glutamine methyltransferase
MTAGKFLQSAENKLKEAGISSARLDVLILLEDILRKDRAWVLANPEHELNNLQVRRLRRKVERRANHIPLAYIRGHAEFYGRTFKINRHVLQPRMETEVMIELLKKLPLPTKPAIADIGTGSGCLGITAALELPGSTVDLYDISAGALAVAKHNTHLHETRLHARKMNLLSRPLRPYDAIITSLPYVPDKWQINQAAMAEPKIAIFGGKDGLEVYRKLFHQLQRFTWKPKFILAESLPPQHENLAGIAAENGFRLYQADDFIQVFTPE